MDDTHDFIRAFLTDEADTQREVLVGDAGVFRRRTLEETWYAPGVTWDPDVARFKSAEKSARVAATVAPRPIFGSDAYATASHGTVVAWVLGQIRRMDPDVISPWRRVFVASTAEGLRIVSVERGCVGCSCAVALTAGGGCDECGGSGWVHLGADMGFGPKLELGAKVASTRLLAPTHPSYIGWR
ncbi:MAG: hypothetical protein KBB95_29060 [Deltaproteobacteria bacterium]|nr:hypothetical protein [Deltaproteobacteria bacterium]